MNKKEWDAMPLSSMPIHQVIEQEGIQLWVPRKHAKIFNDLFERRQESDYVDFVSFTQSQVQPWINQAEDFVKFITDLIQHEE
jgi:uncharacterized protein (UPF0332 family)